MAFPKYFKVAEIYQLGSLETDGAFQVNLKRKKKYISIITQNPLNPIWHGRGYFYPLVLFGSDFVS